MKKVIYPVIGLVITSLIAFTVIAANWKIKENESVVKFSSGKINGSFKGLKADIAFDTKQPEQAKFSASIETKTIATGFFLKTGHAKDALDVDKYPTIKFVSTSVSGNAQAYVAKGNLTMKGITKPATINFTFEEQGNQSIFKGNFEVVPKEYGIDHSGTPDKVTVNLIVPVTKS